MKLKWNYVDSSFLRFKKRRECLVPFRLPQVLTWPRLLFCPPRVGQHGCLLSQPGTAGGSHCSQPVHLCDGCGGVEAEDAWRVIALNFGSLLRTKCEPLMPVSLPHTLSPPPSLSLPHTYLHFFIHPPSRTPPPSSRSEEWLLASDGTCYCWLLSAWLQKCLQPY